LQEVCKQLGLHELGDTCFLVPLHQSSRIGEDILNLTELPRVPQVDQLQISTGLALLTSLMAPFANEAPTRKVSAAVLKARIALRLRAHACTVPARLQIGRLAQYNFRIVALEYL